MTKGIRAYTNEVFNNTLPQLPELGAIAFRREVMAQVMAAFDIGVAPAATHYNHSLKMAKANNPEAVAGLGRSEDKKGGRKPTQFFDVVKAKSGEVVATGVTKAVAEAMIAKAAAAKKAKLSIKVVINMPAETATTEAAPAETAAATTEAAPV